MPLTVNLRHLEAGPVRLQGELPASELDLTDLDDLLSPAGPLRYELEFSHQEQGLLIQGRLEMSFACECVRCLKPFAKHVVLSDWSSLLPWHGEGRLPVVNDTV